MLALVSLTVSTQSQTCSVEDGFAALNIPSSKRPLAIHIQTNPTSGWGNFGLQMFEEFHKNDLGYYPVMTMKPNGRCDDYEYKTKSTYQHLYSTQKKAFKRPAHEYFGVGHRKQETPIDFPVLLGVAADFDDTPEEQPIWSAGYLGKKCSQQISVIMYSVLLSK
jgi:hypothetical protein